MIMFWNRKEIYVGYSMENFNTMRDILVANAIKYTYRLVNHHSARRSGFGSFGENLGYSVFYYLYVHANDYEKAKMLIQNR